MMKETFFSLNRKVIVTGLAVCMILPLIKIEFDKSSPLQEPLYAIEKVLTPAAPILTGTPLNIEEAGNITNNTGTIYIDRNFNLVNIFFVIYIAGAMINLIWLLLSTGRMLKLIKEGQKVDHDSYRLVLTDKNINPFTWKNYIVISRSDYIANKEEIISHEKAHINHKHFIDLLFVELILSIQWFNPSIWLLKRELKTIHEYQADKSVLQSGIDATIYQLLLVKKAVGASSYTLASSFNHIKIKKRITMMLREKSSKWTRLKVLLLLPVGLLTMYAFANPRIEDNSMAELSFRFDTKDDPKFSLPLKTYKRIAAKYGVRGKDSTRLHPGYDMVGYGKDTIYAVFSGTISKSDLARRTYGNYIIIKHDNDLETLYAHNSVNLVKEGDVVKAGQPIGIIGNTGRSTGEHLHFEIKKGGEAIDPASIIDFEKKALR
jgi:beta-lactamase regulating signal transducer with metallopeptidase domain/biotin carboxyl carrier protein